MSNTTLATFNSTSSGYRVTQKDLEATMPHIGNLKPADYEDFQPAIDEAWAQVLQHFRDVGVATSYAAIAASDTESHESLKNAWKYFSISHIFEINITGFTDDPNRVQAKIWRERAKTAMGSVTTYDDETLRPSAVDTGLTGRQSGRSRLRL